MEPLAKRTNGRIIVSLLILLCFLLTANIAIMVRGPATAPVVEHVKKEAPEDSSMKQGIFQEDNTIAPKEERVSHLFSLKGKTAIVSGSGQGIGLAVVKAFAEAGANVAIWYHSNKEALNRAAEIEETYGVKCKALLFYICVLTFVLIGCRQSVPGRRH